MTIMNVWGFQFSMVFFFFFEPYFSTLRLLLTEIKNYFWQARRDNGMLGTELELAIYMVYATCCVIYCSRHPFLKKFFHMVANTWYFQPLMLVYSGITYFWKFLRAWIFENWFLTKKKSSFLFNHNLISL